MPDTDLGIRAQLIKSIHQLRNATIALFLSILLVTGWGIYTARQQSDKLETVASRTAAALCTFRADLRARYESGLDFLKNHPDGIPGISAADIQRTLDNQKSTLDSLAGLPCGE